MKNRARTIVLSLAVVAIPVLAILLASDIVKIDRATDEIERLRWQPREVPATDVAPTPSNDHESAETRKAIDDMNDARAALERQIADARKELETLQKKPMAAPHAAPPPQSESRHDNRQASSATFWSDGQSAFLLLNNGLITREEYATFLREKTAEFFALPDDRRPALDGIFETITRAAEEICARSDKIDMEYEQRTRELQEKYPDPESEEFVKRCREIEKWRSNQNSALYNDRERFGKQSLDAFTGDLSPDDESLRRFRADAPKYFHFFLALGRAKREER